MISETRSLSADCLPSLLDASVCGVSASQLFGRSVANFFNPIRVIVKKHYGYSSLLLNSWFGARLFRTSNSRQILRKPVCLQFFQRTFQLISEIRSLSADWLPSLLDSDVSGVSASQYFGRSVANFFHPMRIIVKKHYGYFSLVLKSWFAARTIQNSFCRKIGGTARL